MLSTRVNLFGMNMEYLQISNTNISNGDNLLRKLLHDTDFSDVTLVTADNKHISAHRSVLSASSPFLRMILFESLQQNTFLYLGMVESAIVQALVNFIYVGRCEIRQELVEQLNYFAIQMGGGSLQNAIIESSETIKFKHEAEKTGENLSKDNFINNPLGEVDEDGCMEEDEKTMEEMTMVEIREEEPYAGRNLTEMVTVVEVKGAGEGVVEVPTVGGHIKTIRVLKIFISFS